MNRLPGAQGKGMHRGKEKTSNDKELQKRSADIHSTLFMSKFDRCGKIEPCHVAKLMGGVRRWNPVMAAPPWSPLLGLAP